MPTKQEIVQEIETGPFKDELAPFWADVFLPETEPTDIPQPEGFFDPKDYNWVLWQYRQRWLRIKSRFGTLKPDAAHAIFTILNDPTRRNKKFPMETRDFLNFLAMNGLLKIIKKGENDNDPIVSSICYRLLIASTDPNSLMDPNNKHELDMMKYLVSKEIITQNHLDLWLNLCVKKCSRLEELEWGLDWPDIQGAKTNE